MVPICRDEAKLASDFDVDAGNELVLDDRKPMPEVWLGRELVLDGMLELGVLMGPMLEVWLGSGELVLGGPSPPPPPWPVPLRGLNLLSKRQTQLT